MTKSTLNQLSPVLTGFSTLRMDKAIEKFPRYITIVINNHWEFVRLLIKCSVTPAKK